MANTVIQLKKSSTVSATPSGLEYGEIAINYADGKLFYKNSTGQIVSFTSGGNAFATVNANGTLVIADTVSDVFDLVAGNNIFITGDAINDKIIIAANLIPAFDYANTVSGGDIGPAFDRANSKTYTFFQNTAPATSNAHDLWVNSNTGVVYENFGTPSAPIWAEFGPTATFANVSPGVVSTTNLVFSDATFQTTSATTIGTSGNNYTITVGAASNAWSNTVGASANGWSNTKLANTTGTFAGDLTVTGNTIINKQAFVTYRPSGTVNAAIHIAAANTKGGSGYADVLKISNLSGGTNIDKWIRLNNIGTLEVINNAYSANIFELTDAGDLIIPGNSTFNGTKPGYAPNRPAFRVYGDGTTNINATTTLNNTNWAVDFEQGSNLNGTTGIFTAPVAGLYSVNLTARTQTNTYVGTSAIAVQKTSGVLTTNICYIEWYNNTSANHMGSSTIIKLAAGDTLKVVVTAGQVTFDVNDNWSVAYIG